jgi:hypothetical protein
MGMEEDVIGALGEEFVASWMYENAAEVAKCIREKLGIPLSRIVKCEPLTRKQLKTDIRIHDEGGSTIGLSLKTRRPGRPDDHLDRRWLDKPSRRHREGWKDLLGMPDVVVKAFQDGLARKAQDPDADFIAPQFQEEVNKFLLEKSETILKESFVAGEEDLKLFAVLEYGTASRLTIFRVDDIITFVHQNILERGIHFGGNIGLGDYVWIQRKGGDRRGLRLPKTDSRHPGNQIQIKVLPLELRDGAMARGLRYCDFSIHRRFL